MHDALGQISAISSRIYAPVDGFKQAEIMRWCTKIDKYQVCMNPRRKIITLLKVHHTITKMHCTTDQADGINVKMHHYYKIKASNFTFIPGDTSLLKTPAALVCDWVVVRNCFQSTRSRMRLRSSDKIFLQHNVEY